MTDHMKAHMTDHMTTMADSVVVVEAEAVEEAGEEILTISKDTQKNPNADLQTRSRQARMLPR